MGKTSPRKSPDCLRWDFIVKRGYRLGRAAELCEMPLAAFMDFVVKHGVPTLRYSYDDLEEERRLTDRTKG
jgi:predicted HTH domain antitoxin